jgi:hypothetical protein
MKNQKFINQLQRRIAQISVGASSLRNQGAKGIIEICRDYFENSINLEEFKKEIESNNYLKYLNKNTTELLNRFPENGKSWGAARKGLNLFFREVVYNFYLANHLEISADEDKNRNALNQLEAPLDKDVATGLREIFPELPKWKSIRSLTVHESQIYQHTASKYADELQIPKIHLDLQFWRRRQTN